jgi:hypothetical protein
MYPFVRQQSDGTISAGSRRAIENHDPSLIAQETGSGSRMGRSEGAKEGRESICQQTCASTAKCAWSKGWLWNARDDGFV